MLVWILLVSVACLLCSFLCAIFAASSSKNSKLCLYWQKPLHNQMVYDAEKTGKELLRVFSSVEECGRRLTAIKQFLEYRAEDGDALRAINAVAATIKAYKARGSNDAVHWDDAGCRGGDADGSLHQEDS